MFVFTYIHTPRIPHLITSPPLVSPPLPTHALPCYLPHLPLSTLPFLYSPPHRQGGPSTPLAYLVLLLSTPLPPPYNASLFIANSSPVGRSTHIPRLQRLGIFHPNTPPFVMGPPPSVSLLCYAYPALFFPPLLPTPHHAFLLIVVSPSVGRAADYLGRSAKLAADADEDEAAERYIYASTVVVPPGSDSRTNFLRVVGACDVMVQAINFLATVNRLEECMQARH